MRRIILLACMTSAVSYGCEKRAPQTQAPAQATPSGVEWSSVVASSDGSEIVAYKTLARHADAWYRGSNQVIKVTFRPEGLAVDSAGHELRFRAEDWKGIIAHARAATVDRPLDAVAGRAGLYSGAPGAMPADDFGVIPRYRYRLQAIDDDTLHLQNLGKHDDGG